MNVTRNSSSFRTSLRHITFRTSLWFLVSSRPEAHTCEAFYSDQLYTTSRRLVLDELFHPNKDIELYLNEGIH